MWSVINSDYLPVVQTGLQTLCIIGVGRLAASHGLFDPVPVCRTLNRFVVVVCLPALQFWLLAIKTDMRNMEHWRAVGAFMLWTLLVQIACTAWVIVFEGGKLSRICVHSLVLAANNTGILAPVVLEAAVGPSAAAVGMLATIVLYFQQLPIAMVLFEMDRMCDSVEGYPGAGLWAGQGLGLSKPKSRPGSGLDPESESGVMRSSPAARWGSTSPEGAVSLGSHVDDGEDGWGGRGWRGGGGGGMGSGGWVRMASEGAAAAAEVGKGGRSKGGKREAEVVPGQVLDWEVCLIGREERDADERPAEHRPVGVPAHGSIRALGIAAVVQPARLPPRSCDGTNGGGGFGGACPTTAADAAAGTARHSTAIEHAGAWSPPLTAATTTAMTATAAQFADRRPHPHPHPHSHPHPDSRPWKPFHHPHAAPAPAPGCSALPPEPPGSSPTASLPAALMRAGALASAPEAAVPLAPAAAGPLAAAAPVASAAAAPEPSLRHAAQLVLSNALMWTTGAATLVSMMGLHAVLDPNVPSHIPELGFVEGTLAWLARCSVPVSLFAMGLFIASRPGCCGTRSHGGGSGGDGGLSDGGMNDSGKSEDKSGAPRRVEPHAAESGAVVGAAVVGYLGVKLLLLPLLMVFVNGLLGLDGRLGRAMVVLTCVPVGQNAFLLTEQYGEGAEAVAGVMQVGLLLMLPHVAAVMAALRWAGLYVEEA